MPEMKIADERDVQISKPISTGEIPRWPGVVIEYIVYTDRHENFPRDCEAQSTRRGRCCMRGRYTARASRTAPNLCRGI